MKARPANVATLRVGTPKLGPDQESDFCGIHHVGFLVDDQRAKVAELEAANVPQVVSQSWWKLV